MNLPHLNTLLSIISLLILEMPRFLLKTFSPFLTADYNHIFI